jgi:hypothetical protein
VVHQKEEHQIAAEVQEGIQPLSVAASFVIVAGKESATSDFSTMPCRPFVVIQKCTTTIILYSLIGFGLICQT